MPNKKEYKTAKDLRRALEERLKNQSRKEGVDLNRLRRQVSFDRYLARIFHDTSIDWALKGGFAMQLRLKNSRATKDIDLALKELKLKSESPEEKAVAIQELLQDRAEIKLGDFFDFTIGAAMIDLDNAPYGGCRFPVETRLDGRVFEKFHIDVGIGDAWIEPKEKISSGSWLEFAGIYAETFPAISKEQQFAEKIHTYTLPRNEGIENSRVKDLIDLILLIEYETLNRDLLKSAVDETFRRRNTHRFDKYISAPPQNWESRFTALAKECTLEMDLDKAFEIVKNYLLKTF